MAGRNESIVTHIAQPHWGLAIGIQIPAHGLPEILMTPYQKRRKTANVYQKVVEKQEENN